MVNKAIFLLKSAKRNGINISVSNGELQLKSAKTTVIDSQLLQEIKDNKEGIIDFLNNNKWKSTRIDESENLLKHYDRNLIKKIRLSFSQERLWFIDQLEGSVQYHIPAILRLTGNLNKEALAYALRTVVERHESLRSIVYEEQGEAYQHLLDIDNWNLQITDGTSYKKEPALLQSYIRGLISEPFDLTKDYMLRATLVVLEKAESILVVTMHHIASDGWSLPIIVKEVAEFYESFVEGRPSKLAPLTVQYADFAIWQRSYLQGAVLDNKIAYWKEKLNAVSTLQLPVDFPRPSVQSTRGASVALNISKELADDIQQLCRQQGTTLFMALLAAFKVLLHRYSGQDDICVGTPIAGRQQDEVESLVGFFVNTLALRSEVNDDASFTSLLADVKNTTMDAYEHQEAPFEKIVEVVVKERDMSRSPLFQVLFVLQNLPDSPTLKLPDLTLTAEVLENNTSKYDISFYLTETPNGLQGSVEYCTDIYREQTILRMVGHYRELLGSIVKAPEQKIGLLPMLSPTEEQQLLQSFNDTQVAYPSNKSIIHLFEEQSIKTPDDIAVVFEAQQMSYGALNSRANQFAHYLRSIGVKEETLVPICIERSVEMMIGLLAIMKAGAAYVPIDPDYPQERISYMLEDSGATMVVSDMQSRLKLCASEGVTVIELDKEGYAFSNLPTHNLPNKILPNHLAYVIYTSGSTGRPKGVMNEHAAVVNRLYWAQDYFGLTTQDAVLQKTTFCFDVSVWELFWPLLVGSRVIFAKPDGHKDPTYIKDIIERENITIVHFVPSMLAVFLSSLKAGECKPLKQVLCSGEALKQSHASLFRKKLPQVQLHNLYGPTEAAVDVTCWSLEQNKEEPIIVPIGKPVANTCMYILNSMNSLVPIGGIGQINIGGLQVARGYLNLPDLSAQKFISDPFKEGKMYKTGDLGRWLPDGNIEYLGRIDEQVKIRGFRIELGEIETVLEQSDMVSQAVVLAKEDKQFSKQLVGYIIPNGPFEREAVANYLKTRLPEYMVPALWVEMETMPLTPNGKINRKALPDPDISGLIENNYVAPQNAMEETLAAIWQRLLGLEQVGTQDNFFEIGGHSLMAMRVASAIRKELQVELAIKDLFSNHTIALLANHLQQQQAELLPSMEVMPRPEHIPLSFSQERLWFIDQLEGSVQYHLPIVLTLKGQLNIEALSYSIKTIIARHEVLRTVMLEEDGQAYQMVKDTEGWDLTISNTSECENKSLPNLIQQIINAPFDLSKDYMLRAGLIITGKDEYILIATMHHIASDGWSMSIIVNEVVELYRSYEEDNQPVLPLLPVQYADYAIWQRKYLNGDILSKKLGYWKTKLKGVAALQLPADYPRPAVQSTNGAIATLRLNNELTGQLQAFSQQQGATLFMTLLAALKVLLYRYTGQQDICVGTAVAGRQQQELEGLIGFFINTIALRTELVGTVSFKDLLQQVKATTLEAYAHQDAPFEKVVDVLVTERDMGRSPLFQVMLVLQNTPDIEELRLGGVQLFRGVTGLSIQTTSKFELTFNITDTPQGLNVTIEYCTDLFREETINRMAGHFNELLNAVVKTPEQSIGSLPMLGEQEKQQLLSEFNNTKSDHAGDKNLAKLFEDQVLKTPQDTALIFEDVQLSYQQLNERSNQLAHYLRTKGVKENSLVPLCIDRGVDMLTGILGILKSGAAYVPVDPEFPLERIRYLLEDTGAAVVVTNNKNFPIFEETRLAEIITMDGDSGLINAQPLDNLSISRLPNHLAYVIYTSGSTGTPKGVMVEHGSLLSYLLNNKTNYINDSNGNTGSFIHLSYTFDASLTAMFMPLLAGKAMVIGSGSSIDVFEDNNLEKYSPYDFIKITPAHIELLQPKMKMADGNLLTNKLVIGGEALLMSRFNSFIEEGLNVTIVNEYGPTEATVGCSVYSFETLDNNENINNNVPIGKPIDNVNLYILGESNELVPLGVTGELCIAGSGLASGYLNLDELTADKFVTNPFSKQAGTRMYKTGDLAKWLPDGNIEYMGRKDDQIKIRGYRIELGEIESVLLQSELVNQAVVIAKSNKDGSKRLVAYVVHVDVFEKDTLMAFLASRLPAYMVPSQIVELEFLPLTTNGKIDRNALPDTDGSELLSNQYAPPRDKMERAFTQIWHELLQAERIGINDNFFELGGDSILTIQVVSRARRLGYDLKPKDLFIYQTISRLCTAIAERGDVEVVGEQGVLTGASGLLPIQKWWFEIDQPDLSHFNQSILLSINKNVNAAQLEEAIGLLTEHHDALRFRYTQEENNWKQEYGEYKTNLIQEDIQSLPKDLLASKITAIASEYQRSLDIKKGKLIRVAWMQTPSYETNNRLFIVIHHLAIDGVSWRILLEGLELLLNNLSVGEKAGLGPKTSSYRQWHHALENYGHQKHALSQVSYWAEATKSYYSLPVDKAFTGLVKVKDIARHSVRLSSIQTSNLLQEVPRVYHTEINDILLAALAWTMTDWSGKDKIIIGLEGHGREDIDPSIDTSKTIGWFTSLYPLLLKLPVVKDGKNLIQSVKEQLRQVHDKGLGYGVLKYIIKAPSLNDTIQPWDIVFNYLGQLDNVMKESKWLSGAGESQGPERSDEIVVTEKLSVNSSVRAGELQLNWSYSTKHYNHETIKKLSAAYLSNLQLLIAHCIEQQNAGGGIFTPSDYGLSLEIGYEELDCFLEQPLNGKKRRDSIEGLYRLSGLQQGMLFHGLYDSRAGAYTEQLSCDLKALSHEAFKKSFDFLIAKHTALRSGFYHAEFIIPVQFVYKTADLPIAMLDYSLMDTDEQAKKIKEYEASDDALGFEIEAVPLMRVTLFKLGSDLYRMLWTYHHLLFDGWSMPILMEEFLSTYDLLAKGKKIIKAEEDRYEDYIRYIERSDKDQAEQYWRNYLKTLEQRTLLPFISTTAERTKGVGVYKSLSFKLDTDITGSIERYAQQNHITVNTLVQGVWSLLLHNYTGSSDIVYGVTVSGRPDDLPGVEQRVGMYINTLPLHSNLAGKEGIVEWLEGLQDEQVSSRQYQYTPLQDIQAWTGISGDLFDSLMIVENYPVSKMIATGKWNLEVSNININEQTNYPLTIFIAIAEKISIRFSYNAELLKEEFVQEISGHFEHVLLQLIKNKDARLSDIEIVTTKEKHELSVEFNNTETSYPSTQSITGLFEEQSIKTPDEIAVVFEGQQISYEE
ncbi:MAG: amino acid adenylation domain-containing protein, partial [Ferruginibacter sp.]